MRVVVADDVMLVRTGIVALLRAAGVDVVAECRDGEAALRAVAQSQPDAVVMDIRMPPAQSDEGIVAARRIRAQYPGTAVLLLSQHLEAAYAQRLLAEEPAGLGYLLKEKVYDVTVLVEALRAVTSGQCVVDDSITARLVRRTQTPTSPLAALSAREAEVLGLIADGLSNTAIGTRLGIQPKTVESTVASVFRKLGLDPSPDTNRRVLAVTQLLRA